MGILAKQETKRQVAPIEVDIGPWLTESQERTSLPELDLVGFAVAAAVLDTPTNEATTSVLAPGKHNSTAISNSWRRSFLRAEGRVGRGGAAIELFTVDALGNEWSDWRLHVVPNTGHALIEVAAWRTREDSISNLALLQRTRNAVVDRLRDGVDVSLIPGVVELDELVSARRLPLKRRFSEPAAFEHDFVLPPPDWLQQGTPMAMPAAALDQLLAAFDELSPQRSSSGDALRRWPLGVSGSDATALDLVRTATEVNIAARVPHSQSLIGAQRSFRAIVTALNELKKKLKTEPAAASALEHYISQATLQWHDPDRADGMVPVWSPENATPAITVPVEAALPIGVRVTARPKDFAMLRVISASRSTVVYQRRATSGRDRKTRKDIWTYTARRFVLARNAAGDVERWGRFTEVADNRPEVTLASTPNTAWWWEVGLHETKLTDDRSELTLIFRGISHSDGVLAYGIEQLALLRSFINEAIRDDPDAQIETICLAPR